MPSQRDDCLRGQIFACQGSQLGILGAFLDQTKMRTSVRTSVPSHVCCYLIADAQTAKSPLLSNRTCSS